MADRYPASVSEPQPASAVERSSSGGAALLESITAALPRGEDRPGQRAMADAVADAIGDARHLVVAAGTGTGKSLAYLVPALASGKRVVVATATKALQDQLADKDLPFIAAHLDRPITWAVLKGRANYACRQRLHEIAKASNGQLALDGLAEQASPEELTQLAAWATDSPTGDRAELSREPSPLAWAAISVSARECPGASQCPSGATCFAEAARARAAEADVTIVNQHLFGLDVASGGSVLPEHDVVIVDEAHQLEDIVAATAGVEIGGGRFTTLARAVHGILDDPGRVHELDALASRWVVVAGEEAGRRIRGPLPGALQEVVLLARARIEAVMGLLRSLDVGSNSEADARRLRATKLATALLDDLDVAITPPTTSVTWVEGTETAPALRVAPLDIGALLSATVWPEVTAVLTSATIPPGLAAAVGINDDECDEHDVGSPFDYERHALLYCAAHLPDPRAATFDEAVHEELDALITAAGGRTLALFTSYRAMDLAAEALRARLDVPILTQRDRPKPALLTEFADDEATCLFATMGFWQGVDVPGPSLSLVTIDRLPFPRPDDPLLQARRELARADAFRVVDLPRATTLLAQGAGRLIRTADDRGVVAVLDPRLATAKRYRWDVVRALPPMRRTRDRAEAEAFLRSLRDGAPAAQ